MTFLFFLMQALLFTLTIITWRLKLYLLSVPSYRRRYPVTVHLIGEHGSDMMLLWLPLLLLGLLSFFAALMWLISPLFAVTIMCVTALVKLILTAINWSEMLD